MERQVSTIHINKFVDLPDGSTVQIVASGPLLTFLVIQKQQNGSRVLYEHTRLKKYNIQYNTKPIQYTILSAWQGGATTPQCAISCQTHNKGSTQDHNLQYSLHPSIRYIAGYIVPYPGRDRIRGRPRWEYNDDDDEPSYLIPTMMTAVNNLLYQILSE